MHWTARATQGLGAVLLGILSACGGSTIHELAPTAPHPSPLAPSPASAGFLHVRTPLEVTAYRIDAQTGRLQETARQNLGAGVEAMTGDPQGRFVYLAYNPLPERPYGGDEPRPSIVAFSSDPRSGALTALSEEWISGGTSCANGARTRWDRLSAGSDRVHAVWVENCMASSVSEYILVTHTVTNDGLLGPAMFGSLSDRGWDGLIDARSGLVYSSIDDFRHTPLSARAIEPDGRLTIMGGSSLCLASPIGGTSPLVGARGFAFALASPDGEQQTICMWEGARLAPRANLGFAAERAAAYVPDDATLPARIAFASTVPARSGQPARYELRLLALKPDGDLQQLDTIESAGETTQMLFHPNGRFLYANAGSTLQVFSISPEGRLTLVEMLDSAAGPMAVTTPR